MIYSSILKQPSLSDTSVIPDQALFAANQLGLAVRRPDIDDRFVEGYLTSRYTYSYTCI